MPPSQSSFINYHSAGKHDRGFYTFYTIIPPLLFTPIYYLPPFTIYPHLLFTPIYCLPPFTLYPHLLFTPIYYLPPFTIYPHLLLYPFTIFRALRLIGSGSEGLFYSSKHSRSMSKMTEIRNKYVEIFMKFV